MTKTKRPASTVRAAQSRDDCARHIHELGNLQRLLLRERSVLDDLIAAATRDAQPLLQDLCDRIEAHKEAIQTWCEAHREELLGKGDRLGKTAHLVTGEVAWRARPPSVRVRGEQAVIEQLLDAGLDAYVRTIQEINKAAVLADPEGVRSVRGITVVSGVEDFVITPFEVKEPTFGSAA